MNQPKRHKPAATSQRRNPRSDGAARRQKRAAPHPQTLFRARERVADRPGEGLGKGNALVLKPGREKSLQRRHPWIFSGAIERIEGAPVSGDTVAVCDIAGNFLAWAAYNPASQMSARVWSWDEKEAIDAAFFRKRIDNALAARAALFPPLPTGEGRGEGRADLTSSLTPTPSPEGRGEATVSTGCRLIHGESDGLPGLIVDRYDNVLVMQLGSAGAERWREACADALWELCQPVCIYERSDSDGRELEGLPKRCGVLRGALPDSLEVVEHGIRFAVDVAAGQKTGFYLDQRDNRALTGELAAGREVLNCFCYTGGFSLYALRGGGCVGAVDGRLRGCVATGAAQRSVERPGRKQGRMAMR